MYFSVLVVLVHNEKLKNMTLRLGRMITDEKRMIMISKKTESKVSSTSESVSHKCQVFAHTRVKLLLSDKRHTNNEICV